MELEGRDRPVDHDLPEVSDIQIERVEQEQTLYRIAVAVDGVEDGGQPHDELGQDAPQILHVPEEHEQRGQDQPDPHIEHDHAHDGIQQKEELPGERYPVERREREKDQQRQPEVDEGGHVLREQEQVFGHVHLGEDPRVARQRVHAQVGGVWHTHLKTPSRTAPHLPC